MIDKGIDETLKKQYSEKLNVLQEKLDNKNKDFRIMIIKITVIAYGIIGFLCINSLIKLIMERKAYNKTYYRDFSSKDNAYIVDYLMNKKVTGNIVSHILFEIVGSDGKSNNYLNNYEVNSSSEIGNGYGGNSSSGGSGGGGGGWNRF